MLTDGDTLDAEAFPAHVRGLAPVRIGRAKTGGVDSLCSELVALGLSESGDAANDVHERVVSLVEKELISQVLKYMSGCADQSGDATRHQPQHTA